jgi:hypothetical protein
MLGWFILCGEVPRKNMILKCIDSIHDV